LIAARVAISGAAVIAETRVLGAWVKTVEPFGNFHDVVGEALLSTGLRIQIVQILGRGLVRQFRCRLLGFVLIAAGGGFRVRQLLGGRLVVLLPLFLIGALFDVFLQAEVVARGALAVGRLDRQVLQGGGMTLDDIVVGHGTALGGLGIVARDGDEIPALVHHDLTAVVLDHDFADEAVRFLHQDDLHVALARRRNFDTDLSAADTDGGDRGVDLHGVGVGLGDLAGHEGEHALHDGHVEGTVLGRRVVDHLVQDHRAGFTHGEGGFVGEEHADGTLGAGFDAVALVNLVPGLELDAGPVGAGHPDLAGQRLDRADRRTVGAADHLAAGRGIGELLDRGGVGTVGRARELDHHVAGKVGAIGGGELRRLGLFVIVLDRDLRPVGEGQDKVGTIDREFGFGNGKTLGQGQDISARRRQGVGLGGATRGLGGLGHFVELLTDGCSNMPSRSPSRCCFSFYL